MLGKLSQETDDNNIDIKIRLNVKISTESLVVALLNKAIATNHIKKKI